MSNWAEYTFLAWERQQGKCGVCGKYIYLSRKGDEGLIGHHIANRSQGGMSVLSNVQARHQACEQLAHRLYRDGNPKRMHGKQPTQDQIDGQRHNAKWLERAESTDTRPRRSDGQQRKLIGRLERYDSVE